MSDNENEHKLLDIIRNAIAQDEALRKQYHVGDKFRFIRDQLQRLLARLEKDFTVAEAAKKIPSPHVEEGEVLVYVHIYNTQGLVFPTWQKMLLPSLFYEYSINRPIYYKKEYIEALMRSKNPHVQHAYLTIAVKPEAVFQLDDNLATKDSLSNPLIKVKEGSLRLEKMVAFTHEGQDYKIGEKGILTKKTESPT